jgi:hypothetical protein
MSCSSQKLTNVETTEIKAISELREKINKNITDADRKLALLNITSEIEREGQTFFSFYQNHKQKLTRINSDYKATRQDFAVIISAFNTNYEYYLKMLVEKRSEMRELTTADEWKKIMDRKYSFIPG